MKIAVIADTHGRLPQHVAEAIRSADEIWHLGDFTEPSMVAVLRALGPAFQGVLGNCDAGIDLPEELFLERAGRTFRLIHAPPRALEGAEFLLHGHTHVPRDEKIGPTRVLNPGTIGKPNHGAPPSWAWLEVDAAGAVTWSVVRV
jgi:putative phosphoesterase